MRFRYELETWLINHTQDVSLTFTYYANIIKNQLVWRWRNEIIVLRWPCIFKKIVWSSAKINCKICIQRVLEHKLFAWTFSFQHWTITITHPWWIRISRKYQNDPWTPWLKSPDSPVPDKMHRPALNLTCINGINKLQITSEIYFLKL